MSYSILDWDSDFFGLKVAKIHDPLLSLEEVKKLLFSLKIDNVDLVYWPSKEKIEKSEEKNLGGILADEKTTFLINFSELQNNKHTFQYGIDFYEEKMPMSDFYSLAIQSGKYSRFSVDGKIPEEKFHDLYKTWIARSLRKDISKEVLVIQDENKVIGMVTIGEKDGRGDIGLIAVDEKFRGKRYGEKLVNAAQGWFVDNGYKYGQVVTQGANIPACNLYRRCGYFVEKVEYFYHFWL